MKNIKEFVESLDMPSWGYINKVEVDGVYVNITYCDSYHIKIDMENCYTDGISAEGDIAWGKRDIEFALNVFNRRDEILEMVNE